MDFIISLAHFCEIHGPTSILCTQVAALACSTCQPCETPQSEDLFENSASLKNFWETNQESGQHAEHSSSFDTPPMSPQDASGMHNPYFPGAGREDKDLQQRASHRRNGSSSTTTTDFDEGCENCTFIVPKDVSDRLPYRTPGSPRQDGKGRHGTPVLRTRQSIVVPDSAYDSERSHASETDDDTHSLDDSRKTVRKASLAQQKKELVSLPASHNQRAQQDDEADESAVCTPLSETPPQLLQSGSPTTPQHTHKHTLSYISARHPYRSDSYSLLRRSCIRTLSQEKLPSGGRSGPIYFGDAVAGYSVAYIFRLPDPRARGRWRTYALIALGGSDGWRVARAMYSLTKEFEKLANSIASLAEATLERESEVATAIGTAASQRPGTASSSGSATTPTALSSSAPAVPSQSFPLAGSSTSASSTPTMTMPPPPPLPRHTATTSASSSASPVSATSSPVREHAHASAFGGTRLTPVSSFLSAKKLDPDGYPRFGGRELVRPKGLAEIVGREDFFVLLHAEFALILRKLAAGF